MKTDIYHHIVLDPATQTKVESILDKFELLLDQLTEEEGADREEIVRLTAVVDDQAKKLQAATPASIPLPGPTGPA
jgi:chorismate mutase